MSLYKMDKSLKELHKKLEEERMLRELPGLVAGIEDACASRTWHRKSGWRLSRTRCASWMQLLTTSKEDFKMDKIWANRLVAGTKTWAEMPTSRRAGVKAELARRVTDGEISEEQYKEITGEDYYNG